MLQIWTGSPLLQLLRR